MASLWCFSEGSSYSNSTDTFVCNPWAYWKLSLQIQSSTLGPWGLTHAFCITRTCESQRTPPIGFGSPKITCLALANLNSRAVLPGTPWSPQEVRSQEVTHPQQAFESVPAAGMQVRYAKPWASALPSRLHPPRFPASGEFCQVLSARWVWKKEKSPKTNPRTPPVLMNEKLSKLQKFSQLFWEQSITQITEEILQVISISHDL